MSDEFTVTNFSGNDQKLMILLEILRLWELKDGCWGVESLYNPSI